MGLIMMSNNDSTNYEEGGGGRGVLKRLLHFTQGRLTVSYVILASNLFSSNLFSAGHDSVP